MVNFYRSLSSFWRQFYFSLFYYRPDFNYLIISIILLLIVIIFIILIIIAITVIVFNFFTLVII